MWPPMWSIELVGWLEGWGGGGSTVISDVDYGDAGVGILGGEEKRGECRGVDALWNDGYWGVGGGHSLFVVLTETEPGHS
jgi:hypothetical protein